MRRNPTYRLGLQNSLSADSSWATRVGASALDLTALDLSADTLPRISDTTSSVEDKSWETFLANSFADLLTAELILGSMESVEVDFGSGLASTLVEVCCVNVNPSAELFTGELIFVLVGNEEVNFGS